MEPHKNTQPRDRSQGPLFSSFHSEWIPEIFGVSAGTEKLCSFGNLGLVIILSCFVSCHFFLLFYVSLRNLYSGTHRGNQFSYAKWNGIFHQAGLISFYSRLSTFPIKRITRENAEGSWWSGCLQCRNLLHVKKFTRIQSKLFLDIYLADPDMCDKRNLRTFLEGEYAIMQTGRTDPKEVRNDQLIIFQGIRS